MKNIVIIAAIAIIFSSCRDKAAESAAIEQKRVIDSMKVAMKEQEEMLKKQKTIDSMKAIADEREARASRIAAQNSANNAAVAEKKRKGWSNTAKGAVIGAGVGAITGAAVSKKKGEGAIIGGLAGAGVGAGTGAIIDAEKKKKANQ